MPCEPTYFAFLIVPCIAYCALLINAAVSVGLHTVRIGDVLQNTIFATCTIDSKQQVGSHDTCTLTHIGAPPILGNYYATAPLKYNFKDSSLFSSTTSAPLILTYGGAINMTAEKAAESSRSSSSMSSTSQLATAFLHCDTGRLASSQQWSALSTCAASFMTEKVLDMMIIRRLNGVWILLLLNSIIGLSHDN